jgi:hypothetical protein
VVKNIANWHLRNHLQANAGKKMLSSEFVAVFTIIDTEQFLPPKALLVDDW